jgi:uncharacterized protein (TIGR03435 family)
MLRASRFASFAAIVATAAFLQFADARALQAQDLSSDWEKTAGGKMAFDVASVKPNTSGDFEPPSFPLDAGDAYSANGGLFRLRAFQLMTFIQFAYKLQLTPSQSKALLATLPKWVATDRFDIEAHGPPNATKDQMRLMMRSLLADRFKLAVHFETLQRPVFALVLEKAGKTGPQLIPHSQGPPCDAVPAAPEAGKEPSVFPATCNTVAVRGVRGCYIMFGSRNTTMDLIASAFAGAPGEDMIDRPVIDKTGLTGHFDFILRYTSDIPRVDMYGAAEQFDNSQPTFFSALKEQLGLKLDARTGPVKVLFIDHVEEPSPN